MRARQSHRRRRRRRDGDVARRRAGLSRWRGAPISQQDSVEETHDHGSARAQSTSADTISTKSSFAARRTSRCWSISGRRGAAPARCWRRSSTSSPPSPPAASRWRSSIPTRSRSSRRATAFAASRTSRRFATARSSTSSPACCPKAGSANFSRASSHRPRRRASRRRRRSSRAAMQWAPSGSSMLRLPPIRDDEAALLTRIEALLALSRRDQAAAVLAELESPRRVATRPIRDERRFGAVKARIALGARWQHRSARARRGGGDDAGRLRRQARLRQRACRARRLRARALPSCWRSCGPTGSSTTTSAAGRC